jgi:hypothetical protein
MDGNVFDVWSKALVKGAASRRGALRIAAGAALGAELSRLSRAEVGAGRGREVGQPCKRDADCSSRRCKRGHCVSGQGTCPVGADVCAGATGNCNGHDGCACAQSAAGKTRCVYVAQPVCGACAVDADCRPGFGRGGVCVAVPAGSMCNCAGQTYCAFECPS